MPLKPIHQSKLFEIWRKLDQQEAIRLKKWLSGSYSNTSEQLLQLHTILSVYYPDFKAEALSRAAVFQQLYPTRSFNSKLLATLMSLLTKKIEAFLVQDHFLQDQNLQQQLLLQVYQQKEMPLPLQRTLTQSIDQLSAKRATSWEDISLLSQLYEKRYRLSTSREKALRTGDDDLLQAQYFNDLAYRWREYRFLLELRERERITGVDYSIKQRLALLNEGEPETVATLQLYRTFITMDGEEGKAAGRFAEIKQLWFQQRQEINKEDQSILLFYLINLGVRIHLRGKNKILAELLELYKIGVEEDLMLSNNQMTARTFANIVTTANLLGDFEFTRTLLRKYSAALPDAIRADAITWATTHLAFYSKDKKLWKSSLQLQQMGSIHNTFIVRTRILLIQMWFEDFFSGRERDGNFMLYFCDAFNLQLKRSKLYSEDRLAGMRAFIKYTRTLIRLKMRNRLEKDKLKEMKVLIEQRTLMPAKDWLLGQIKQVIRE